MKNKIKLGMASLIIAMLVAGFAIVQAARDPTGSVGIPGGVTWHSPSTGIEVTLTPDLPPRNDMTIKYSGNGKNGRPNGEGEVSVPALPLKCPLDAKGHMQKIKHKITLTSGPDKGKIVTIEIVVKPVDRGCKIHVVNNYHGQKPIVKTRLSKK